MDMSLAINLVLDGDNAWPDLAARQQDIIHLADGSVIGVAVLDGDMTSGLPSVAFRIDLADGHVVVAETSWRLLATAVRGVAARYGWPS
jgi:hypothetical protein